MCTNTPLPNRRLMLIQQRGTATAGHDTAVIEAPEGYRVVSGGWNAETPENVQVLSSVPSCGGDAYSGTFGNESWQFYFEVTGTGTGGLSFYLICEADPYATLVVSTNYGA